jgi:hypothetical protein
MSNRFFHVKKTLTRISSFKLLVSVEYYVVKSGANLAEFLHVNIPSTGRCRKMANLSATKLSG